MENQLKATELRLNNQVFFSDEDKGVKNAKATIKGIEDDDMLKFTAINVTDNSTKTRISISQNTIEGWGELSQFSGIPLTEDILLRLGFEIEGLRSYYHNDLDITIEYLSGKYAVAIYDFEVNPASTHYIMHCEFLHTLQNNVFALTGEELTFKK